MSIIRQLIPEPQRCDHTGELFGLHFPLAIEPTIFSFADRLSPDYQGGYWIFYAFSNGSFFMAPDADTTFRVNCENGFKGNMTADALGITACLYAYSHLAFSDIEGLAEECARHYHLLRDYMIEHVEVRAILAAID